MMRRATLAALTAGFLSGCLVVVDDQRPRPAPPPPPARPVAVVYTCTWHDARYVIWREYFDCDDYEIYYCESLWGYDEDDLLVLLYISRLRRVPIRTVVYEYDRHHRDLFAVALFYRMTGDEFFVAGVAPGSCPPPYGRAYGYYWRRERGYRLSNEEVRALVHLRIGVEFYGYPPHEYFREHERLRGGGQVHVFREMAVRDYRKAGSGGRNVHQAPPKRVERPWEVSDRQEWERRRDEARERARAREAQEPPRHPEAERARRQFEEAERARREEAARKAREEEERRRKEAEEARRRQQEEERRKKEAEEAARRAREEEQRRLEERKRQEDLRRRQEEQRREQEEQKRREDQKKKEEQKRRDDQRRR